MGRDNNMKKYILWFLLPVLLGFFCCKLCYPCEVLILARNDVDESIGQYAKYDPIVVKDDGWPWGSYETNKNLFYIIKLPQVTVPQAEHFIEGITDENGNITRRRKMALRISALPVAIKNALLNTGTVTIDYPASTIRNYILDK